LQIGRSGLWPLTSERLNELDEDALFDVIEFLYRHVSVPSGGWFHAYAGCGWHYGIADSTFDPAEARRFVRETLNRVLGNYGSGYEISQDGEVQRSAPDGLAHLLEVEVPTSDPMLRDPVHEAVRKYRSRSGGPSDRRDAVRDLFDVLERLRPQVREHLMPQDEKDLFTVANKFAIRHHDAAQRYEYDSEAWWSWMFYVNLATVHLLLRKIAASSA
jgi:hypothetical protein